MTPGTESAGDAGEARGDAEVLPDEYGRSVGSAAEAERELWDAIVVGSGLGGAFTAFRLAEAGLRVLVLERGGWPRRDDSAWDADAIVTRRIYRSRTPYEQPGRWRATMAYPDEVVGGKSVFFAGACLRLRADDLRRETLLGRNAPAESAYADWPIDYDDLEPYYTQAEAFLQVAGVAGADPTAGPRSAPYGAPPLPYSEPAKAIEEAGQALGFHPFPLPLAINYEATRWRAPCAQCLTCDGFVCKVGAKNDASMAVLPLAMRLGARVLPHTVAARLDLAHGRFRGVETVDLSTRRRGTLKARLCVVSCGAVDSAKLLLGSGLGGGADDTVGRFLMTHCNGLAVGVMPRPTNPNEDFPKQVAFTDPCEGRSADGRTVPHIGCIQGHHVAPVAFVRRMAPFGTRRLAAAIGPWMVHRLLNLLVVAEDAPLPRNRVTLSTRRTDEYGIPLARVRHDHTPDDRLARRSLLGRAASILREAGAFVRVPVGFQSFSHSVGTCRFGDEPRRSVLDRYCGVHGVPNLFVVDGSFMPTSGGVNPGLTISANALRVGAYLADRFPALAGA
jgi:choline dehydrogenase-like flavoprotein